MNQNENTRNSEDRKVKDVPGKQQETRKADQSAAPQPGEKRSEPQPPESKPRS